jgi:hypothetical protein
VMLSLMPVPTRIVEDLKAKLGTPQKPAVSMTVISSAIPRGASVPCIIHKLNLGSRHQATVWVAETTGGTGPGGGIVFITPATAGNTTGRYFEAAPNTWSVGAPDPTIAWCDNGAALIGATGGGGTGAVGAGARNTAEMMAWCASGAANSVRVYLGAHGTADWFLPSKGELHEMYVNRVAIGGFTSPGPYWSSSENIGTTAWSQWFNNSQVASAKTSTYSVRPIRTF